jgi:hypothetical protein
MPIELGFKPAHEDEETYSTLVESNCPVFISDFSEGTNRILSLSCSFDDSGGEVKIYDANDLVEIDGDGRLDISNLPKPLGRIAIREGVPYEQEFASETTHGTLSLRLVSGVEVTRSSNIPRGLCYPN